MYVFISIYNCFYVYFCVCKYLYMDFVLGNLAGTATYNPSMFSILGTSSREFHLLILETFLITKYQPVYKNNFIHCFFLTILLDLRKSILLPTLSL